MSIGKLAKKIEQPKNVLIEQTALQLAASHWETGKSMGLTSKYLTAAAYAKANLERFIPKATSILLDMLKSNSNCTPEMRQMIYDAMMERHDDPNLQVALPNYDVQQILEARKQSEFKKIYEIASKPNEPKKSV